MARLLISKASSPARTKVLYVLFMGYITGTRFKGSEKAMLTRKVMAALINRQAKLNFALVGGMPMNFRCSWKHRISAGRRRFTALIVNSNKLHLSMSLLETVQIFQAIISRKDVTPLIVVVRLAGKQLQSNGMGGTGDICRIQQSSFSNDTETFWQDRLKSWRTTCLTPFLIWSLKVLYLDFVYLDWSEKLGKLDIAILNAATSWCGFHQDDRSTFLDENLGSSFLIRN